MPNDLYEADFVRWAERNAELLRSGAVAEADLANIAEEIDDLGKNWRRALDSHLTQLLAHLLKLKYQPEYPGTRGWRAAVAAQRIELIKLLERAPSLKPEFENIIDRTYRDVVYLASAETGLPEKTFPPVCPWDVETLLDRNMLP